MSERVVGLSWKRKVNSLPCVYLRWRRGGMDSREVYVSTRHVRFRLAFHAGQVEWVVVFFRRRRSGEAPFSSAAYQPGLRWVRDYWHLYDYDGAPEGSGEWFEVEGR